MSHVVKISLEVKSLDALAAAAKALGGELVLNQKTFKWFNTWVGNYHGQDAAYRFVDPKTFGKCTHAIKHPKCGYEIGVVQKEDGTYILLADEWKTGGLVPIFGQGMQKLNQQYGAAVARKTMQRQGWRVTEQQDAKTGDLRLVCTR